MAAAPRKAVDKRKIGSAKNPKVVQAPSATDYKAVKKIAVVKGKAGRPKKAR
jgi:hypothetical protein